LPNHFSEPRTVLRKAGGQDLVAERFQFARQQAHLRLFAAAVDTFNGDECSSIVHELNVYRALV
jgi:hypothetical protein